MFRIYIMIGLLYTSYKIIYVMADKESMECIDKEFTEKGILYILGFVLGVIGVVITYPIIVFLKTYKTIKSFMK